MDGANISNDTNIQVQKQADAFDTALKYASENVLGKKLKNKYASWVSPQTKKLLNTCNKAAKRYKRTRQEDNKDQWKLLQGHQVHLDTHLAALKLRDRKHEHGTAWEIINNIAGEVNKADLSKVRLQHDAIPNFIEELLEGWRGFFASLLNNWNANANPANYPEPSKEIQSIKFARKEIDQTIKESSRKKHPVHIMRLLQKFLKMATTQQDKFCCLSAILSSINVVRPHNEHQAWLSHYQRKEPFN